MSADLFWNESTLSDIQYSPYLYTLKELRNRLHGIDSASHCSMAESITCNEFLGSLNVYNFGLSDVIHGGGGVKEQSCSTGPPGS
jgi:hypothetical protein